MAIYTKTAYIVNGQTVVGVGEAKRLIDDQLGGIIDRLNDRRVLSAGDKIAIHDWLQEHRQDISRALGLYAELAAIHEDED